MNPATLVLPAAILLLATFAGPLAAAAPAARPLFAPDLSNAEFKPGSWAWEGNDLVARGVQPWAGGLGNIWTKESYGDFLLNAEFQCAAGANSGIFIRCGDPAKWLHTGIEIQIFQGTHPNEKQLMGAIYDCQGPSRRAEIKPGQWHRLTIRAAGTVLTISVDGEQVNRADLADWKEAHKNPDGSKNKFNTAYRDMPRTGRIGLQYHGQPLRFRNLTVEAR